MIIKALLLVALCCAGLLSLRSNSRTAGPALRRLGAALLLALGALSVLFPGMVTAVANSIGVGRGTDLVVYVLAVTSLFGWIGTHKRLRGLEDRVVTLARRAALTECTDDPRASAGMDGSETSGDDLSMPVFEEGSPTASPASTS